MALKTHAEKSYQIKFVRVEIAPRLSNGTYDAWKEITQWVISQNTQTFSRSIDSDDFDIGYFEESNLKISLDNRDNLFTEGYGYFYNRIVDKTKFRLSAGYYDTTAMEAGEEPQPEYNINFEGFIDGKALAYDVDNDTLTITALAYSSIFKTLRTDPGAVGSGQTFKNAFYALLNRSEVTNFLTVELANISPKINNTVDNASWFAGKQLDRSINALLLASNSVLYVKDNTVYVKSRENPAVVRYQFFSRGSDRPCNVETIKDHNYGHKRIITRVEVSTGLFAEAADDIQKIYGSGLKKLDIGFITNTEKLLAIGDDILSEFQLPKQELLLTTDYLGGEIELLDMVTIDHPGVILEAEPARYGNAVYGQGHYVTRQGGARFYPFNGWKVLGITHDYRRFSTTLKLREIGNTLYDGNAGYYNPIYSQAIYGVSPYAA